MLMHVQARLTCQVAYSKDDCINDKSLDEGKKGEIELWRRMPIHNGSSNAGEFVKSAVALFGIYSYLNIMAMAH
jgi:hypothetical protein